MSADTRPLARRALDAATRAVLRIGFSLLKRWWWLTHPTIEGVYVAVRRGDDVLVIRNSYRAAYSFPSGRRGRKEDPARAAARELREEVGIDVPPEALHEVAEVKLETKLVDDHVHFFELRLTEPPAIRIDRREVVWAEFEPLAKARSRELLPLVRRYVEGTLDEIRVTPAGR